MMFRHVILQRIFITPSVLTSNLYCQVRKYIVKLNIHANVSLCDMG